MAATEIIETGKQSLKQSLWRRIYTFPLMAMLVGVVLYMIGLIIAFGLASILVPPIRGFTFNMKWELIAVPILILVYVFLISKLGDPPRNDFRDPKAFRHLLFGLLSGTVIFSAIVGIAAAIGVYRIIGIGDLSGMQSALIIAALFPAVSEEILFRGILLRWLEEFGGTWAGLIVSSALFGAAHLGNPGATWVAAVWIAVEAGVLLGGAYLLTRSLWLPMGLHAAWNFTQGEIFDVPVSGLDEHGLVQAKLSGPVLLSGGTFGLEASLIALVIATAAGVWLVYLSVRKGNLVQPWWVRRRTSS